MSRNKQIQLAVTLCSPRRMPSDSSPLPGSALVTETPEAPTEPGPATSLPCSRFLCPLTLSTLPAFRCLGHQPEGLNGAQKHTCYPGGSTVLWGYYLRLQRPGKEQTSADRSPRRSSHGAEAKPGLPGIPSTWTEDCLCHSGIGTGEGKNNASLDSPGRLPGGGRLPARLEGSM